MNKETLRMQMLSGVITEGEYKAKLKELNSTENKDSSRYDDLAENIYSSGFSANDTGRPKFHQMTADEIEDYLEKDKDNPSRLFGRSLTLVKSLLKAKREEEKLKESLNEHYIAGGIVGVGAINNPFEGRKKESYEDAFEHFLGQKYNLKEAEEEVEEGKEVEEPSLYEGELNENIGSSIEKMIDGAKFEFSEKGNDEMIELANYILTPEGAKNVAMSLKNRLKGEGGENYFTSKPEALQSLLDKLK